MEATLLIKRIYIATIIVVTLIWAASACAVHSSGDNSEIGRAFKTRTSDVQVEGEGIVEHILADDIDGSRHQWFIVRLESGQTYQ